MIVVVDPYLIVEIIAGAIGLGIIFVSFIKLLKYEDNFMPASQYIMLVVTIISVFSVIAIVCTVARGESSFGLSALRPEDPLPEMLQPRRTQPRQQEVTPPGAQPETTQPRQVQPGQVQPGTQPGTTQHGMTPPCAPPKPNKQHISIEGSVTVN